MSVPSGVHVLGRRGTAVQRVTPCGGANRSRSLCIGPTCAAGLYLQPCTEHWS